MNARDALLSALLKIEAEGPTCWQVGICRNARAGMVDAGADGTLIASATSIMRTLMAKWPEGTGDFEYPVPSGIPGLCAQDAYEDDDNYLWSGDYGDRRKRLLAWMIYTLQRINQPG